MVSESCVMWATTVPILVFLGLCSRLRPDVSDRQTSDVRQTYVRQHHRFVPRLLGAGHKILNTNSWSKDIGYLEARMTMALLSYQRHVQTVETRKPMSSFLSSVKVNAASWNEHSSGASFIQLSSLLHQTCSQTSSLSVRLDPQQRQ